MKTILSKFIVIFSLPAFLISCSKTDSLSSNTPNIRPMQVAESSLLVSSNDFCFDYFKILSQNEPSQNVMFSPYSAHAALSMLIYGASGVTKQEIKDALRISSQSDEEVKASFKSLKDYLLQVDKSVTLKIANSIWARQGFPVNANFTATMNEFYQAEVNSLDFDNPQSVNTINNWVSKQTASRIPTILEKLNADDMMVLLNAVYFKSDWKTKFNAELTTKAPFTKDDASVIQVDMMQSDKMEAWQYSTSEIQFIDIPFGNGGYLYSVIMPQGNKTLDDLIAEFTMQKWQAIISLEPKTLENPSFIQLKMPRFKFAYEQKMNDHLQSMGMKRAFTQSAELLNLFSDSMSLMVSNVTQKAFIQIDENGGEAAAVTSITVGVTSVGPGFTIVNRPFVFVIREKNSNAILFIGKVHQPVF
jgi:serpin B